MEHDEVLMHMPTEVELYDYIATITSSLKEMIGSRNAGVLPLLLDMSTLQAKQLVAIAVANAEERDVSRSE